MDPTVQNTLAIAFTGLMTTIIMSFLDARKIKAQAEAKAAEKAEDYRRQDEVADKLEKVRLRSEENSRIASSIARKQVSIVSQIAKDQGTQTEIVSKIAKDAGTKLESKLDQIHILVNSNLTSAMEHELIAQKTLLSALDDLSDMKRVMGIAPTEESKLQMEATRVRIAELETQLAERFKQTAIANQAVESANAAAGQREAPPSEEQKKEGQDEPQTPPAS